MAEVDRPDSRVRVDFSLDRRELREARHTDFFTSLHVLLALQAYPGDDLADERAAGLAFVRGEQLAG